MPEDMPGMGHNTGDEYQSLKDRVNEFGRAAKQWGEEGCESQDAAERVNDFLSGARKFEKELDALRIAEKRPHDEASKAVQAKYKPLIDAVRKAIDSAKQLLGSWMQRQREAEEAAERDRLARLAEEEAAARVAAADAEARGDLVEAAEAAEKAEDAAEALDKGPRQIKGQVKSASGAGRTAALRKVRRIKIINPIQLIAHYKDHPDMIEVATRIANADLRAAKGADIQIPGCEIIIVEQAA